MQIGKIRKSPAEQQNLLKLKADLKIEGPIRTTAAVIRVGKPQNFPTSEVPGQAKCHFFWSQYR